MLYDVTDYAGAGAEIHIVDRDLSDVARDRRVMNSKRRKLQRYGLTVDRISTPEHHYLLVYGPSGGELMPASTKERQEFLLGLFQNRDLDMKRPIELSRDPVAVRARRERAQAAKENERDATIGSAKPRPMTGSPKPPTSSTRNAREASR